MNTTERPVVMCLASGLLQGPQPSEGCLCNHRHHTLVFELQCRNMSKQLMQLSFAEWLETSGCLSLPWWQSESKHLELPLLMFSFE